MTRPVTSAGVFALPTALTVTGVSVGGIEETLADSDGVWQYVLVFALAAIPWFEVLLVVPPAVALGLDPLLVAVTAFLGNGLTLYAVIVLNARVLSWWRQRRSGSASARRERAQALWERFGLRVFAFASPVATGTHIGAVLALLFGASRRAVTVWMSVSLAAWTVALVVASSLGLSLLGL